MKYSERDYDWLGGSWGGGDPNAGFDDIDTPVFSPPTLDAPKSFLVTATLQLVVQEGSEIDAIIHVKDALNEIISESKFASDPMNGAIVENVLPVDE